ncbi:hypothetical protein [Laspinema olomoucense]|uniref:hypothetical protein n=1 Tax=Laspinema olomoucense TaxID=3231600 RepID=UPI0021BA90B7|nr:hypothetical protein [Laspinema sp. D3d]MCT7971281.1 hypothetical protein [Laspinema sp. D3d]
MTTNINREIVSIKLTSFELMVYKFEGEVYAYQALSVCQAINQPLSTLKECLVNCVSGKITSLDEDDEILPEVVQYYWFSQWQQGNELAKELLRELAQLT